MQINVYSKNFHLTPQVRGVVVSRMLSALAAFRTDVEMVVVRLQANAGHGQPDTTVCDVAVSLQPAREVRARAEDADMALAVDGAAEEIRRALDREVSRLHAAPGARHIAAAGPDTLHLVLRDNQITQHQREWLERPENYLRPIRIREYWRPPGVEDDAAPHELEAAVSTSRGARSRIPARRNSRRFTAVANRGA